MPDRIVMLYDGHCGLCTSSQRLVRRLDWLGRIEYLDAQARDVVAARFPGLDPAAILGAIHVITPEGRVFVGYEGVRALTRALPPVMWLYPLLFLPGIRWLGPKVYNWIAANRYRFNWLLGTPDPCEAGRCPVHAPVSERKGE
ncbi:MAG: DUF393 domain-containing protein [Anaerolineae bacterium]|nr:DUF393 domain-containing protein [Anaerolineae bacterium]